VSIHDWDSDLVLGQIAQRPGVYIFRDGEGAVLYVGKALSLRSRLSSYRRPGGDGRMAVRFIAQDARQVETIITRTEQEALLLEDALIKQHKPPHNIRLKDDKSFLMIRLDQDEEFPRLKLVRAHSPKLGRKGGRSRLFGPYASARAVRQTLSDLHRVVPLRDCADSVLNNRSRPCLKHQIGLCSAPCVNLIDAEGYQTLVERATRILSGDVAELESDLDMRMRAASEKLEYELAATWRDRLSALRRTTERQGVTPRSAVDRDILGLARRGDRALIHRLAFRGGRLVESRTHEFRSELPDEELLHGVVTALYASGRRALPPEVVVPCMPADGELLETSLGAAKPGPRVESDGASVVAESVEGLPSSSLKLIVPQGGERARMLGMAGENARAELIRREASLAVDAETSEKLADLVDLPPRSNDHPLVVDCFDISNFQGSHVVASRVRFRGGVADRAGYRRFKVRDVEGQDDFASMREVVMRSLKRGLSEDDLPDLIVIDGGSMQLAKAIEAREEVGAWDVVMVGLAKARPARTIKGRRLPASEERVYLTPESVPIELPRHSAVRHLLERVRDEAHRFAITYHRKERGKIRSRLDSIAGIGPAKRKALLRRFGSVQGVAKASLEELAVIPGIGMDLAQVIREELRDRPE
jgi:excinuclease ABC subunit C